jgi:phosphonate ABC transporter permease subunit PhnE
MGQNSGFRFLRTFFIVTAIVIAYAYGFQVTEINLEAPKEARRQEQLTNVMRALARPDLFIYETERVEVNIPLLVPCPAGEFTLPDLSQPGPSLQLSAGCAEPESEIVVAGAGFEPKDEVLIFFVPFKEDTSEEVQLPLAARPVSVNSEGNFSEVVQLKKGRTSENPQKIRAVVNRRTGLPSPSETVYDTVEKIIETVFLALIATTLGTLLSIPISFLAAKNLMAQVSSLFGSLVTLIVAAPLGWIAGWWLFGTIGGWGLKLMVSGEAPAVTALWVPALLFLGVQALAGQRGRGDQLAMIRSYGVGVLVALAVALALGLIAGLGQRVGLGLIDVLGDLGFLGNFLYVLADILAVSLPLIGGLVGMLALTSASGALAENLLRHADHAIFSKGYTVVMSGLAGIVLFGLPASLVVWLYELPNRWATIGVPAAIGGVLLGLVSLRVTVERPMPTGLMIYYATRTILNVLRAIEPLIMAIVFVVWVGIGPFAGVLALTLHTIASLGKLYSEQVENISQGPIEAVTATGATRLQTIVYAVIPQIVPPYIAFTIYRWDINVRMSTIIGFAGGGGIGFLLQQNLNLLKYRQASVQMIAIAIVVASLDYISAKIRERII